MMNILAAFFLVLTMNSRPAYGLQPFTPYVGENWVVLYWQADEETGIIPLSKYLILRSPDGVSYTVTGTTYIGAGGVVTDTRSFWDQGLTASTMYTYKIEAPVVSGTFVVESGPFTVTTSGAKVPFGTVFTQSGGRMVGTKFKGWVRLNWSTNPFPGEAFVSIYKIFRATHPDGTAWTALPNAVNTGTFLDDDDDDRLLERQPYYYMVFPCCPDRRPSLVTGTPFLPARGQGLPVARTDAAAGPRAIRLSWDLAIPGSYTAAIKYVVFRSDDGGSSFHALGPPSCVQGQYAACHGAGGSNGVGPPVGEFEFVDLTPPTYGRTYVYVIRPLDSGGNLGEAYRTVVIDVPLPANRLFLDRNQFKPPVENVSVHFQITEPGLVRISVFTLTGERVATLHEAQYSGSFSADTPFNSLDEGLFLKPWNGTNVAGELVGSGAYLVVLEINKSRDIRTIAVIR